MTSKPDHDSGDKPILIYTTFPALAAAEAAASKLLDGGLIACANIIPGMVALYDWQGNRHRDAEVVMILKTRACLVEAVMTATRAHHPYDNPAIIAIDPIAGSADYFAWIAAQTAGVTGTA